jgi:hypothetical protein
VNDENANAAAARASVFQPLLAARELYDSIELTIGLEIDGEPTYAMAFMQNGEMRETLIVSQRTYRTLRRVTPADTMDYADYRRVDGELVAFRTVINDALGQSTLMVQSAQFDETIPDSAFQPAR